MFGILQKCARRRERPPTPAISYTHTRRPRHSALSTCLPVRPSNYQSRQTAVLVAGLLQFSRATAERAATNLYAQRHNGAFNKAILFSTRKSFIKRTSLLHVSIHFLLLQNIGPSSRIVGASSTWPRRRKSHFYCCVIFGERSNSVFSYSYALKCSWS